MVPREEIERRTAQFPQLCRQAGLKVTPQRGAVYGMLAATDEHPTPEAIHAAVREILPSLSLATVYKILDQFEAVGLVLKLANPEQAARYDARVDNHQHTVCAGCGRIADVVLEPVQQALSRAAVPGEFRVSRVDVVIHGLCRECAARTGSA